MPQIPSPVPTVEVKDQPLPRVSVNAPEAAFGGATAAAINSLGKTIEGSGSELFSRAIGMKELDNHTEATEALTQYTIQQGNLQEQYKDLRGNNAKNGYEQFQKDSEDTRLKIRATLSNPAAQRLYDTASKSTFSRSVITGANHAAEEFRRNILVTSQARVEAAMNEVYLSSDPKTMEANLRVVETEIKWQGSQLGWSGDKISEEIANKRSQLASSRVLGIAAKDPQGGDALFRDYRDRGLLQGRDADAVETKVRAFTRSTGTDIIAKDVAAKYALPDGTFSKSVTDMENEAVAQAKKLYPDDPRIETSARNAFKQTFSANNYVQTQDRRDVRNKTQDFIAKGVSKVELLPPELRQRMTAKEIEDFPTEAQAYQHKKDVATNQLQYTALMGMYNNENEKFMDTNFLAIPGLSKDNINFFRKLQREAAPNGDPRVNRAMTWLRGYNPQILDDLRVTGPNKVQGSANQFVGALHEAIQSYQEVNGKAPDEKIVTKEIFPAITRQITEKGIFWNSQTPFFKTEVPKEYTKRYLETQNPKASDAEIRQNYQRQMFDHFFAGQKTSKDQGRVGQ